MNMLPFFKIVSFPGFKPIQLEGEFKEKWHRHIRTQVIAFTKEKGVETFEILSGLRLCTREDFKNNVNTYDHFFEASKGSLFCLDDLDKLKFYKNSERQNAEFVMI